MSAVALYAIPDPINTKTIEWIKTNLQPFVRPYIYTTSQWQQWNLFSPDPMRRVTKYYIVTEQLGNQTPILEIARQKAQWWRGDDEMTIIRRLEDIGDRAHPILSRYAAGYCRPLGVPDGTLVRFIGRWTLLPKVRPGEVDEWWLTWKPTWKLLSGPTARCPADVPAGDIFLP